MYAHHPPRALLVALAGLWLWLAPLQAQESEVQQLRAMLNLLSAEQQTLYQQFQMLQALRSQEQREAAGTLYGPMTGPPQNYDDLVAQREAAAERADAYRSEMDALYTRHRELELQKQPLLERLQALTEAP